MATVALWLGTTGCGDLPAVMTVPPDMTLVETPIPDVTLGEPLMLKAELLYEGGAQGDEVGFVGPLPTEAVAFTLGRQLEWLASGAMSPRELGADSGPVHALLAFGRGASAQVLVGGDKGLFAVVAGILERSPLAPALGSSPVRVLLDSGTPDAPEVWIVTGEGMFLWSAGLLRTIHLDTLVDGGAPEVIEPSKARFTVCRSPTGGHGSLVILPSPGAAGAAGSDRLMVLPVQAATQSPMEKEVKVALRTVLVGHPLRAMACDSRGVVTAASDDKLLIEVDSSGKVTPRRAPQSPKSIDWLAGDPGAPVLWMGSADTIYHGRSGAWQKVIADWSPFVAAGAIGSSPLPSLAVADLGGPLLVAGPHRVGRVRVKAAVEIKGLGNPPTVVNAPIQLDVVAPYPDLVRAIDADLDGTAQWNDLPGRRVAINPWSVAAGPHLFHVKVTYSDGPPLETSAMVTIVAPAVPPGWAHDVEPIYSANCKKCHGPNGSGHLMATAERWQAEIATILSSITTRRMPLPPNTPLNGIDSAILAGWKSTGFAP